MADLNDRIIQEAADEGESLLVDDFVRLVEQYHTHDRPGVAWETLEAYAHRLDDATAEDRFDADGVLDAIEGRITDGASYEDDAFYRLDDDRVSLYPSQWHDDLGDETDLTEYVRYLTGRDTDAEGGAGIDDDRGGVPQRMLPEVVGILGGTDPDAVEAELRSLRNEGELVADTTQHPNSRIHLPEDAEDIDRS